MSDLYLYHATDKDNLYSIMSQGLLINPPKSNWSDMYCDNQIFLALNAHVAIKYVEECSHPPKNIIVFKIPLDALNSSCINYDWNNRCEYTIDINSISYKSNIPKELLSICNPNNEPEYDIYDFEGTELFDIVKDVFDYEVETNLEQFDDEIF